MTRLNERMRPEGKKTKQKHLHSWRISLGEKKKLKTFHAVLLLVTQSASSKRPQAGDLGGVGGALTSAGFLSRHREMEGEREGIKPGGLFLEGIRGSLLLAGGELADLAGCGDSFTRGVG